MTLIDGEKLAAMLYKAQCDGEITKEVHAAVRDMMEDCVEAEISERATPKKPVQENIDMCGQFYDVCPVCATTLVDSFNDCFNFCPSCGQAIDWINCSEDTPYGD